MKQLLSLFLALLPCLAWAQYPSNGNQKITLGEQTTADGLIWRGVASIDTVTATSKITRANKQDTSAYLLLDTVTNLLWHYKIGSNGWSQAGGSTFDTTTLNLVSRFAAKLNISDTASMLTNYWRAGRFSGTLPVANGGTNATTLTANKVMVGNGTDGVLTPTNLHWDNTNSRLGIATPSPTSKLHLLGDLDVRNANAYFGTVKGYIYFTDDQINCGFSTNAEVALNYNYYGYNQGFTQFRNIDIYNGKGSLITTFKGSSGNVGIGILNPTAVIHLKAGTATGSTAPLKFTSGTNLTTAEAGAMEFNGTNLLFTPSTTRHTVNHGLTGSATLDFASTNAQNSRDMTISVTGAADGDVVSLGVPNAAVNANTSYSAWVSAAGTVTVRFNNYSSGTVDPASGSFKVFVTK